MLTSSVWGEVVLMDTHIINKLPSFVFHWTTSYQSLFGLLPTMTICAYLVVCVLDEIMIPLFRLLHLLFFMMLLLILLNTYFPVIQPLLILLHLVLLLLFVVVLCTMLHQIDFLTTLCKSPLFLLLLLLVNLVVILTLVEFHSGLKLCRVNFPYLRKTLPRFLPSYLSVKL